MLGNGGVFCWYSYINPLLTHVSGFRPESITLLMVLAGFGMVVGNLVSDRLPTVSPGTGSAFTRQSLLYMLLIYFLASISWLSVILMCLCTAGLFALSSPQQVLLIRFSPGGEMLGAASVQVAFNLGKLLSEHIAEDTVTSRFKLPLPALLGTFFALRRFYTTGPFLQKI